MNTEPLHRDGPVGLRVRIHLLPRPSPLRRFFMPNPYSPIWRRYKGVKLLSAAFSACYKETRKPSRLVAFAVIGFHALTGKLVTWDVQ